MTTDELKAAAHSDTDPLLKLIGVHQQLLEDVIKYIETLERERDKLRELIAEVVACGVEYAPPLGRYAVVQIPKELIRELTQVKGGG